MPFRKVNSKEEIEKFIKKNPGPGTKKEMKRLDKEYEDIKAGRINKKFCDD